MEVTVNIILEGGSELQKAHVSPDVEKGSKRIGIVCRRRNAKLKIS
jgi:hypothetical protein